MSDMKRCNTSVVLENVVVGIFPHLYDVVPEDSQYDAGKYVVQLLIPKGSTADKVMGSAMSKITADTLNGSKSVIRKFLKDGDIIDEHNNSKPEKQGWWRGHYVFSCRCNKNDPPALIRSDLTQSKIGEIITGSIVNANIQVYSTDKLGWKICYSLTALQKVAQGELKISEQIPMEDKIIPFKNLGGVDVNIEKPVSIVNSDNEFEDMLNM